MFLLMKKEEGIAEIQEISRMYRNEGNRKNDVKDH